MLRSFATLGLALPLALSLILLTASSASADVLIVRERGKILVKGIKSTITVDGDKIEVDKNNVEAFMDEHSTGVVVADNYTGVVFKAKANDRTGKKYPRTSIVKILYTKEPDGLVDGLTEMSLGNWARAIGALKDVLADKTVPWVHRHEANFRIGICYISQGKLKSAARHYGAWPEGTKSSYTPEVHRIVAEIYTSIKGYKRARAEYAKIEKLPEITQDWVYRARLGLVKIDIAENKSKKAENGAKQVADATRGSAPLANAHVLALALQGKAIVASKEKDRLAEAESLLKKGALIEGPTNTTSAELYATLGDCLYAQGRLEDARFPYMRVVCIYPDEQSIVAHCLLNAGQALVDMSGRIDGNPEKQKESDDLLVKGMKLISECGRRHRGSGPANKARSVWQTHKARYEKLTKG